MCSVKHFQTRSESPAPVATGDVRFEAALFKGKENTTGTNLLICRLKDRRRKFTLQPR
jgi:hypothetical protein